MSRRPTHSMYLFLAHMHRRAPAVAQPQQWQPAGPPRAAAWVHAAKAAGATASPAPVAAPAPQGGHGSMCCPACCLQIGHWGQEIVDGAQQPPQLNLSACPTCPAGSHLAALHPQGMQQPLPRWCWLPLSATMPRILPSCWAVWPRDRSRQGFQQAPGPGTCHAL